MFRFQRRRREMRAADIRGRPKGRARFGSNSEVGTRNRNDRFTSTPGLSISQRGTSEKGQQGDIREMKEAAN
jgi:hypothetical protein